MHRLQFSWPIPIFGKSDHSNKISINKLYISTAEETEAASEVP